MTHEQAAIYRWLVENKPHQESFPMNFRQSGNSIGCVGSSVYYHVCGLMERGWLKRDGKNFAFVHPVKRFNGGES